MLRSPAGRYGDAKKKTEPGWVFGQKALKAIASAGWSAVAGVIDVAFRLTTPDLGIDKVRRTDLPKEAVPTQRGAWKIIGPQKWRLDFDGGDYYLCVGEDTALSCPESWEYEVRDRDHGLELLGWAKSSEEAKRKAKSVGLALIDEIKKGRNQ